MPQLLAGTRTEPPVSVPRAKSASPLATAEADPLDEDNLIHLLAALGAMDVELDAVLVATSTEVEAAPGWKVIRFSEEGVKA